MGGLGGAEGATADFVALLAADDGCAVEVDVDVMDVVVVLAFAGSAAAFADADLPSDAVDVTVTVGFALAWPLGSALPSLPLPRPLSRDLLLRCRDGLSLSLSRSLSRW